MNHQLVAIKEKNNHSLARCIADNLVDAGNITVAYCTLSYLFDAFLMDNTLEITKDPFAKTWEMILANLEAWAADAGDMSIYWLNGMAGTGKTIIAFTFSQILDNI
ncbi:hypothetical protein L208DRAFT_1379899 [Tricholoma matsutake]|nr:hypothetical protein L208DRAFT_1379899 [Tricholoma matsutake 945]